MTNLSQSSLALIKPPWLRKFAGHSQETAEIKRLLRKSKLNTVCEEARCPNISECFSHGTATFMILGDVCTRGCRFCAVQTGKPHLAIAEFSGEAERVAEATALLKLKHVVVTSVARDDLEDGGASGFALTILALRRRLPELSVEVLIPDFRGNIDALHIVLEQKPDVLNHNLETVPRLYRRVRPGTSYLRSLELLRQAKKFQPAVTTKTGIMLGLGENQEEVFQVMKDAAERGVNIFTAGQYMQPTREHLPVEQYVSPEEFTIYQKMAEEVGFSHAFIGPLVRSSYHAGESFIKAQYGT